MPDLGAVSLVSLRLCPVTRGVEVSSCPPRPDKEKAGACASRLLLLLLLLLLLMLPLRKVVCVGDVRRPCPLLLTSVSVPSTAVQSRARAARPFQKCPRIDTRYRRRCCCLPPLRSPFSLPKPTCTLLSPVCVCLSTPIHDALLDGPRLRCSALLFLLRSVAAAQGGSRVSFACWLCKWCVRLVCAALLPLPLLLALLPHSPMLLLLRPPKRTDPLLPALPPSISAQQKKGGRNGKDIDPPFRPPSTSTGRHRKSRRSSFSL